MAVSVRDALTGKATDTNRFSDLLSSLSNPAVDCPQGWLMVG
jgi:hypothetical protein